MSDLSGGAPALAPDTFCGIRPASKRASNTPRWAYQPQNELLMQRVKGAWRSQEAREAMGWSSGVRDETLKFINDSKHVKSDMLNHPKMGRGKAERGARAWQRLFNAGYSPGMVTWTRYVSSDQS